jgi:DNA repair exonuclease SbcCD ATPase subunit
MTIDERLQALIQSLELTAQIQRDNEQRWEKRFSEHDKRLAELDMRLLKLSEAMTVNVGIVDRVERKVEDLADAMNALAKAQAVTEEKLQRFIESLRRGGNGHN